MKFPPFQPWLEVLKSLKERLVSAQKTQATFEITTRTDDEKGFFSLKILAGNRIYFIDVKKSSEGARYLQVKEIFQAAGKIQERKSVMVFEEHIKRFKEGLELAWKYLGLMEKELATVAPKKPTYAKAYKKWQADEELRLRNDYQQGKSIKELSYILQRQPGAIRSRLKKIGLITG